MSEDAAFVTFVILARINRPLVLEVLQTDQKFVDSLGAVTYQTNTDGLFQALLNRDVDGILVSSVVAAYYIIPETRNTLCLAQTQV